ncbi:probable phosphorylase b kinase regulatory subunit beta isoform X2 [Aphidius gifuensis]|uniref:probable phosphorylase b kinase regulatory subunit beta isoform X2 n=1 Tax=Aphidius gifuensis TaxID=684658 RepID=UPI001CDBE683|nr:probable phosphorylase b kinase regulatory subunit beta isoform X2 [Aphidius gifuensis]
MTSKVRSPSESSKRFSMAENSARQGSVYDLDIDMFLKISNYEDTIRQLDIYYGIVKRQLLNHQSCITGLFPEVTSDKIVGSVKDSIYCAASIWSLYQAYRRIDDDRGKSYELGQSAVKCMRGILECWIKQSDRIELFKLNQCNRYALHCKFNLDTGDEIYKDDDFFHLQIDVVSLYLLFLVQMISSGLQIIYTQDEVAFVQNLVYYVERAYRTPDYGMWERGSRYNDGTPEIHASSIGMAKSALEAINGCNLFGDKGASWSVIYVDIDAHNRNRSIFETMLPRESSSKSVDSGLLTTISFPAFATHEEPLYNDTKTNIINKLKGHYGYKRFGRDGYKTVIEDKTRRFYKTGEIKDFDKIECEWPLFYIFMIIDGVFKSIPEQVEEYQNLLKIRIHKDKFGDPIIPMYYYVPENHIDAERQEPGSTYRAASNIGSANKTSTISDTESSPLYLWNQAMFIIAQLLTAGLLHINELDPIRRYLPSYNRPRRTGRYSAFQGTHSDLVVQIVLIAESMRLQAMMATYGIQTQTPHEVEPVQILSSLQLIDVYQKLGINKKLKLQGRPARPIGSLGTSKVYRVCGMTVLCYPLIFEVSQFYLYRDMALLIDDIKTELKFVGKYWRLSGRPTVCLLIREEHMRDPQFKEMLDLFAMLKKGYCDGTKVRIGRLQNLISSSCIEHLDFVSHIETDIELTQFKQLKHDYIGYQSLTDVPRSLSYNEDTTIDYKKFKNDKIYNIINELRCTNGIYNKAILYGILLQREGQYYDINGTNVIDNLKLLYQQAGSLRYWKAVRYCSSLLNHTVDSISPFITGVLVKGKQITVGVIGHEETVFDKPMTPAEIQSVMYEKIQPHDIVQAVLQQEVLLYCGRLIGTNPDMFKGILKIRIGWVLEAIKLYLIMSIKNPKPIECYSPYELRKILIKILTVKDWEIEENLTVICRRKIEGSLCRVPAHFYNQVWEVLMRCPGGIRVNGQELPQQPTLTNMSRSELTFSLLVESILNHIQIPEYRQIIVELLDIVSIILCRNPELSFKRQLDLNTLVEDAYIMYCKDNNLIQNDNMQEFFSMHCSVTTGYLARAVVNNVLTGGCMTTISDTDLVPSDNNEMCNIS